MQLQGKFERNPFHIVSIVFLRLLLASPAVYVMCVSPSQLGSGAKLGHGFRSNSLHFHYDPLVLSRHLRSEFQNVSVAISSGLPTILPITRWPIVQTTNYHRDFATVLCQPNHGVPRKNATHAVKRTPCSPPFV
jgi:hypothetical protein